MKLGSPVQHHPMKYGLIRFSSKYRDALRKGSPVGLRQDIRWLLPFYLQRPPVPHRKSQDISSAKLGRNEGANTVLEARA